MYQKAHITHTFGEALLQSVVVEILVRSVINKTKPPLWSRGTIVASQLAGPGSTPVGPVFRLWFFRCFSSTVRRMSGKLNHILAWVSLGYRTEIVLFCLRTMTVSDLIFA